MNEVDIHSEIQAQRGREEIHSQQGWRRQRLEPTGLRLPSTSVCTVGNQRLEKSHDGCELEGYEFGNSGQGDWRMEKGGRERS